MSPENSRNEDPHSLPTRLPPSVVEQHVAAAMEGKYRDEAEGRSRIVVCITRCTSPRKAIRDDDNVTGKYLRDQLRYSGLIPEDDRETINKIDLQAITKNPKEMGTLVTILWP